MNLKTSNNSVVCVETMPEYLRESHRAAGNWGRYPGNGAERTWVSPSEASAIVAADADGYAHVVRTISAGDRVEGGRPGTDEYDTGTVMYVIKKDDERFGHYADASWVMVGWDSGVQTPTDPAEIRPLAARGED